MKKKFFLLCMFLSIISAGIHAQTNSMEKLKRSIDSAFQAEQGNFAIAFKSLSEEHPPLLINEDNEFHAASTMKTPVMIEVFKQAKEGKFSLNDSIKVKNEFKSIVDGSSFNLQMGRDDGEHLYEQLGEERCIKDLVVDMIIYSINLATNILIELVGARNVNESMRAFGAEDINVLRGVEDMKAYDAGMNNTTTAHDLMLIFERLAKGEAVDAKADKEMIDILMQQKHKDIIPALLPNDVKIANKTGWITGVHHDSAIVFLPNGQKYVLVLLSENMKDSDAGTKMLANVSKMVYDFSTKNK